MRTKLKSASHAEATGHLPPLRIGIGGWSYAPWRQTFFPNGLPQRRALEFVSQSFNAVEVNATFYGSQKPETFAKWRAESAEDFVFALKAPRLATHRTQLDTAEESIQRFLHSGIAGLGPKLGPLLWQFAPSKSFEAEDFERFLKLLPKHLARLPLRHVVDVRHPSFAVPDFVALCRRYSIAICVTDASDVPQLRDTSSDIVYLRLRNAQARLRQGYPTTALKSWARDAKAWQAGGHPSRAALLCPVQNETPRETFVFFINGAKERAPAAALRFRDLLRG